MLAVALGWSLEWPLVQWTNVHLVWGFVAWAGVLLAAVGCVVVPMFQQTPNYPDWFVRGFSVSTLALVLLWTGAQWVGWAGGTVVFSMALVLVVGSFACITLRLQRVRKRPTFDAVQRLWQVAMLSVLAACVVWLLAHFSLWVNQWRGWPLLFGVLLLFGSFMSVMVGMLYKIVPFLVWLHLQNRGAGVLMAPNTKKVLDARHMNGQMYSHLVALVLLLAATGWPQWLVYPAGVALVLSNAWLLRNLLAAVVVYRSHVAHIVALEAG